MISYLFINLLISLWALAINRWTVMPERTKFPVLMLAMMGWLMPYGLISIETPIETINIYSVTSTTIYSEIGQSVNPWTPTVTEVAGYFMLTGVLLFIIDVIKLIKQHYWLVNNGQSTSYKNVLQVDGLAGACVSGFWRPKIWVNSTLLQQEELAVVLAHERQHIKQGDVYWLLIVGFINRIFWFNPVVLVLNKRLCEVIELRCDEACQKQFENNVYQKHLARIVLAYQQSKPTALINEIAQNNSFQIKRIKQLSQEKHMTKKHKLQLTVSLILIALLSTATLANQETLEKIQVDDNEMVVNVSFEVSEQFSGLRESSSTTKQMVAQFNQWQTLALDRYVLKFKVSEPLSEQDDKHFMIETQLLNSQQNVIYSPSLMTAADKEAGIEISGKTDLETSFKASFTVLSE